MDGAAIGQGRVEGDDAFRLRELARDHGDRAGQDLLLPFLTPDSKGRLPGRIALVSSFGTESALLLALAAELDPAIPVIFLDTGKLFGETLRYRDRLTALLGLSDVRSVTPDPARLAALDPTGALWLGDPDACCRARKVEPLARALAGFDIWISGRKRYQSASRAILPTTEIVDGRLKLNPLAPWSRERIEAEFARRNLPPHPLEADGFLSVGCMPCTARVEPGEDGRAGRWRNNDKTECGIHWPGLGPGLAAARLEPVPSTTPACPERSGDSA
jgi:phosphoadenosine phosphosulfate reductase